MRTRTTAAAATILVACFGPPVLAGFFGTDLFLPSVGRKLGLGDTFWHTALWVHNPSAASVAVTVQYLPRGSAALPPGMSQTFTIPAGGTWQDSDAINTLFPGLSGYGALRITSTAEVLANCRMYNQPGTMPLRDTTGQDYAAIPSSFAIGSGQVTQVLGAFSDLSNPDPDFRTGFGYVEVSGNPANVRVKVFGPDGTQLGSWDDPDPLQPFENRYFTDMPVKFPAASGTDLRLEVEVTAGTGKIIAVGSLVSNGPSDGTTFEMAFADQLLGINVVAHDATLAGDGTVASPLGIANQGVGTAQLADGAVTPSKVDTTGATHGQVLKAGSGAAWQDDGLTLPFIASVSPTPPFLPAIMVENTTGVGLYGRTLADGEVAGVVGYSAANAIGVYGISDKGRGVEGDSTHSWGVFGAGTTGVYGHGSSGPGVDGRNDTGVGVHGESTSGHGVTGESDSGYGVWGTTNTGVGVLAWCRTGNHEARIATKDSAIEAAGPVTVLATTPASSDAAVISNVGAGRALQAVATGDTAVWAKTTDGFAGVDGSSRSGLGVYGHSTSGAGVRGASQDSDGVAGYSGGATKSGVYGTTSNAAGYGVYGQHASSGNIGYLGSASFGAYGANSNQSIYGYLNNGTNGAGGRNGGNWGRLGTPDYAGEFNGLVRISSLATGHGNLPVLTTVDGELGIGASDSRLKKNIVDLTADVDVLSALGSLRGVKFNWDTSQERVAKLGEQREIGMIAQEVEPVLPELVGTGPDGYKSLDYAKLTAFLIEVAKAQQAEIAELRAAIAAMGTQKGR